MAKSIVIRELLTVYGFEAETDAVDNLGDRLDKVKQIAAFTGAAIAGVGGAMFMAAKNAADSAVQMKRNADALGLSLQKYQELTAVFEEFGADGNDVSDMIQTIADRSQDALDGMQSYIDDFGLIGVEVDELRKKKPGELFDVFLEHMGKIEDPTKRTAAAARVLGDDLARKLHPALKEGPELFAKWTKLAHEAGVIYNEEQVNKLEKMRLNLSMLHLVWKGFISTIGVEAAPVIDEITNGIIEWWRANKELINSGVVSFIKLMASGFRTLYNTGRWLFGLFRSITDAVGGLENALRLAGIALGIFATMQAINGLVAMWNIIIGVIGALRTMGTAALLAQAKVMLIPLAIATLIVAIGLVIEDFYRFFNGQNSAIGELIKKYPKLGGAIWSLKEAWDIVKNAFDNLFDQAPGALENFQNAVFGVGFKIVDWWNTWTAKLGGMWDDLIEGMVGKIKAFANKGREALEWVGFEFEDDGDGKGPGAGAGGAGRRSRAASPGDLAKRRASLRAAARRVSESRGAGSTINFKGDEVAFNVTRRAGESDEDFVDRVMSKYDERLAQKRRQMRDNLKSGVKR